MRTKKFNRLQIFITPPVRDSQSEAKYLRVRLEGAVEFDGRAVMQEATGKIYTVALALF